MTEILNINELYNRLSSLFTILNLNQNNQILLSFIHRLTTSRNFELDLSIINMKKDIFSYEIKHLSKLPYAFYRFYGISCFVTVRNFVECLVEYENEFKVEIYGESLNNLNSIFIDTIDTTYIDPDEDISISFIKCIHLKNEIGIFSYYRSPTYEIGSPLYIQIKKLTDSCDLEDVINNENYKFEIAIDKDNYYDYISYTSFNAFLVFPYQIKVEK